LGSVPSGELKGIFNTLTVDYYAVYFKFILLILTFLVITLSSAYMQRIHRNQGEYLGLVLFSSTGMMLLPAAGDLVTLYLSLELTALPIAALAAFLRTPKSSEAAIKFFILNAISSALLLYGMALIYGLTGTTYLTEISSSLSNILTGAQSFTNSVVTLAGITLILAGFGFKISAVPFQMWVPDVYEGSPTPITAYLSVASKAAGFAVLLRVFYTAFSPNVASQLDWGILFAVLAAMSMTVGNLIAISQHNIKRLMGYSTIAHAGYMLVGLAAVTVNSSDIGFGQPIGPSSVVFYVAAYAISTIAVFYGITAISNRIDSDDIKDFVGAGRKYPYPSIVLTLGLASLVGIPPTAIFIAKIYIFTAAIQNGLLWLALFGVLNSVVSAYYYLRIVSVMYMKTDLSDKKEEMPLGLFNLGLALSAIGVVVIGIVPSPIFRLAEMASSVLPSFAKVLG
jgi:NADH-quinone oxidoreductase subunit N